MAPLLLLLSYLEVPHFGNLLKLIEKILSVAQGSPVPTQQGYPDVLSYPDILGYPGIP